MAKPRLVKVRALFCCAIICNAMVKTPRRHFILE